MLWNTERMWWNWSSVNESISGLCASPFWDTNLTWNSTNPDFTPCFEKTALVWLPCLFLWMFTPLEIYFLRRSISPPIPFNRFNLLKLVFVGLLGVSALIEAVVNYVHLDEKLTLIDFYAPIVKFFTFCLLFELTYANVRCGIKSSSILFVFSFFLVLCGASQVRTEIRSDVFAHLRDASRYEVVDLVLYFVFYASSFMLFILNCFADYRSTTAEISREDTCPEYDSSVLSRFLFSWFTKFVWKGYWKTLEADDLWTLDDDLQTAKLSHRLETQWRQARERRNKSRVVRVREVENQSLIDNEITSPECTNDDEKDVSILSLLWQTFGSYYLYGATFKIVVSSLTFVSPLLLNLIIGFIDDRNDLLWHGYVYATALLVYGVSRTLLMNQHFHIIYRLGLQISAALVALIYKKALKLSSGAKRKFTVGEIVNLMAVDAQRFKTVLFSFSLMWGAPLEFCITLYLLWNILGSSVFIGLSVFIIVVPLIYLLLLKSNDLQVKQMKRKDERVKLMTEMLSGIKVLKLYAWEPSFREQIFRIRDQEIQIIKKMCYIEVGSSLLYYLSLMLLSVVSFAAYVLSSDKHVLDARVAFVSLSLFRMLGSSLIQMTYVFSDIIPVIVSLKRIGEFLNCEELDPNATSHEPRSEPVIIEDGRFSWEGYDGLPVLRNVNVNIKAGNLVAVVGPVGSGKSSLLSAILGEMYKQYGYVNTTGTIAYVPQQAWIRNATFKDNITLGNTKEDTTLYDRIVEACALTPDLQILPGGDKTEIGEKGINLSGGQKQRISLARAVYSEADTYLLDDPLSAVDAHVAKHIFEHVIGPNGLLKSKTRILVTHSVTYLPRMDFVIVLKDGTISASGTYEELTQKEGEFANFLATYVKDESNADIEKSADIREYDDLKSSESTSKPTDSEGSVSVGKVGEHCLIANEESETGNVGADVYMYYLSAMGFGLVVLTVALNLLHQGLSIGAGFWLTVWSADVTADNDPNHASKEYFYLAVYSLLGLGGALSLVFQGVVLFAGLLKAAKCIHNYLLTAILRWPSLAFDQIPLGRIINRLSSDVEVLDNTLREIVSEFFNSLAQVMSTVFVVSYTTPIFIVALVPLVIFYCLVQRFFIATSRQLRRLESVSKSPIYSHFEESVTGAQSIRAYKLRPNFICESENRVDGNQKSSYLGFVVNRWLSVRLEMVGSLIVFFSALFAVRARSTLSAGLVGLSVSYASSISNVLYYWVRMTAEAETNVVAIERIKRYVDMDQEAPWTLPNDEGVPADWPDRGEIVFENFRVRYQTHMEPVLKGITFSVNSGEKVGIVGRTGAGKSSLTLSLFRIIESCGGKISIDGIDIANLGLHTLRSRLTIIPQDPVLFAGSLRINLDPSDSFTDENLWRALEMVNLKTPLTNTGMTLHSEVSEGGSNFSVGQRQLICLARALLRKTKVLILDEATAAVDMETDDVIQATIRKEFKDCTVLTIAHRLNTVLDYDKILVLDVGTIVEYDSPSTLLQSEVSVFRGMASDANLV